MRTNNQWRRRRESKTNRTSTLTSLTNQTLVQQRNQDRQRQVDTPKPRHQTYASYQIRTKGFDTKLPNFLNSISLIS